MSQDTGSMRAGESTPTEDDNRTTSPGPSRTSPEKDSVAAAHTTSGSRSKRDKAKCQVCQADLSSFRSYYQRYHICVSCAAAESVPRDGVPMRFCQQCGRFQELSAFEGTMRTCRVRLDKHAARRRRSGALGAKRLREQERRAEAGDTAFQVPAARPQAHHFAPERLVMRDDRHQGAAGRSFSSSQLAALWGGQDLAATPARVADLHGRDSQAEVASLLASLIDQRHRGGDGVALAMLLQNSTGRVSPPDASLQSQTSLARSGPKGSSQFGMSHLQPRLPSLSDRYGPLNSSMHSSTELLGLGSFLRSVGDSFSGSSVAPRIPSSTPATPAGPAGGARQPAGADAGIGALLDSLLGLDARILIAQKQGLEPDAVIARAVSPTTVTRVAMCLERACAAQHRLG
ncbi:hypothetical protein QBZ16_003127 [Prototheca wickerhamii]|uniref:SBP-type domain-containing protein n=1 Tax=Prototheca wickerhamii TaxID=3111 RepID=A0AAD9ILJ9_PROWI|nr:hypothetical protein QBZ16_003127 [Prototheca wickerhamii]